MKKHVTEQPMGHQMIKGEIKKKKSQNNLEANENSNTAYQNQQGAAKGKLRGKLIVIQAYLRREE